MISLRRATRMQVDGQIGSDDEPGTSDGRQFHNRDRRVSWDAEPDVIENLSTASGPAGMVHEWQIPTIAYLHLTSLFVSVCMTRDVLSLGYLALFLVGCATLMESTVWMKRSVNSGWEPFMKAWPFQGARGGGLLLNAYVLAASSFALVAFAFHARLILVKTPEVN